MKEISNKQVKLDKLIAIYSEISNFFNAIIISGLSSIKTDDIKKYKNFQHRLEEFGVQYLIECFEIFINNATEVISNRNNEAILGMINSFITILIYIRTFERVQTKNRVQLNLQSELLKLTANIT